jgi:hypothetical protein
MIDNKPTLLLVAFCPKALICGAELCIVRVLYQIFYKEFAVGDGIGVQ